MFWWFQCTNWCCTVTSFRGWRSSLCARHFQFWVCVIPWNGFAGGHVWAEVLPPVVVAPVPLVRSEPDENERDFPEAFPAWAVRLAMAMAKSESVFHLDKGRKADKFTLPLSDFPLSLYDSDLMVEQRAGSSLNYLFSQVLPEKDVQVRHYC